MEINIVEKSKQEANENYAFFRTQIAELKKDHLKEFALLHRKGIVDFFVSEDDAIKIGMKNYGEGEFSVQLVDDKAIDLGYQSYVII